MFPVRFNEPASRVASVTVHEGRKNSRQQAQVLGMTSQAAAALQVLTDYVALQGDLCAKFVQSHNLAKDRDVPAVRSRTGTMILRDDEWKYQQHGLGVRFERLSDNAVVEAHVALVSIPDGLDAYRVQCYCESVGVTQLEHTGRHYDVHNENSLSQMLADLALAGRLSASEADKRIYVLA